jgi:hypothetical protein
MRVFLDESGDMGWKLSLPFRGGGSSKFLCLAFLFTPKPLHHQTQQVITDLYSKYRWIREKKASDASPKQELEFAIAATTVLKANPTIKIDCIVVKKENVQPHIRADPNKLYNYMCRLVVCDYVTMCSEFEFIPDKRSIKVESGNSLSDYIQTVLWFECRSTAKLINDPQESDKNYNLQFVDWVAHIVWSAFEDGETAPFKELSNRIRIRRLFF